MKLSEISFDSLCYSNAVNSVTYAGIAGTACGFFCGPFEARKLDQYYCNNRPWAKKKKRESGRAERENAERGREAGEGEREGEEEEEEEEKKGGKQLKIRARGLLSGITQSQGLTGGDRAFYEAKSVARYGLRCGNYIAFSTTALFAGFTSVAHYQLKRYWKKDDWVNTCVVGGLAGALVLAASKNLVRTGAHFIAISCVDVGELRKKNDDE